MSRRDAPHDPSIAAAVFCENVLVERDGTHSFIRIVDSVAMLAEGIDLEQEQPLNHPLMLAFALRSTKSDGTKRVTVIHKPPAGGTKLEGLPQAAEIGVSPGRLTVGTVRLTGGHVAAGTHEFEIRVVGGAIALAALEVHLQRPGAGSDEGS